jgi:flagellar hook-associated protein 3 FlgL
MRITEAMRLNTVLQGEASASERMTQLSQMASSGLRVSQPSDDPAAYASIQERQAQMGIIKARSTAATRAAGDLNLAESTLDAASSLMTQARALAVQGSNGTLDDAARASLATQVSSLRQQLIALANAHGASGYLFGGTKTDTPPVDVNGVFQGNAGVTHVEIADGVLAASNANGASAFSAAGGRDVFDDLQNLAANLSTNNVAGLQSSIGNLDASGAQILAARVDSGLSAGRLTSASTVMSSALTQLQTAQANEADADAPTTISNLQAAQVAYEAALQVNKQILSVSLAGANIG